MKRVNSLFLSLTLAIAMMVATATAVFADSSLATLAVVAQNEAGETSEVKLSPEFSPTVTEYTAIVKSDVTQINVDTTTTDSTATATTEWTNLDVGDNKTYVTVTDISGNTTKYTINTKRLTEDEDASVDDGSANTSPTKKSGTTVTVNKIEMTVATSFKERDIPKGFAKSTITYKNKEFPCIVGTAKELTALYLVNNEEDVEGFYIYNKDKDSFYAMNNIEIKSRMYTIVNPEKKDDCLKNYTKKKVTITDKEVRAWVLNSEEGLYLVYAMNWDGDTNLYCYDSEEECFQRYLPEMDVNTQLEAANKGYNTLQDKYNSLVGRYNILVKVIAGLIVLIIILAFVIFNLLLNKKEKKIKQNNKAYGRTYGDEPTYGVDNSEEINDEMVLNDEDEEQGLFIDLTEDVKKEMEETPVEEKAAEPENTNIDLEDLNKVIDDIESERASYKKEKEEKTDPYFDEAVKTEEKKDTIEDDDDFVFIDMD